MDYESLYHDKNDGYYNNSRPEILQFIPANIQSALDIGCGNGAFGELLKSSHKCIVWGIEPNKKSAREAEKKIDKVINSVFSENMPELEGRKFDVVFFNDVLEHLINPEEVLYNVKNNLIPNGYIIASIPNLRYFRVLMSLIREKDFKYAEFGVMDKTHFLFFTPKSMRRLFESIGFRVISVEGINKLPNPVYLNLFNIITFGSQRDMQYPQYVVVATL